MFFFFSLRKFYLRYPNLWTILSLSAIPQILINPFVVFSAGFQLSYLTIGGIVLFHKKRDSKISLSFATVAGTLPIVIYYFNKISFIGILVNLFYVPLFSLITLLSISKICPVSSAKGINASGETKPLLLLFHLINASRPIFSIVLISKTG